MDNSDTLVIMTKKFILPVFIILVGLLCGYFLTVIFSGSKGSNSPTKSQGTSKISQPAQRKKLKIVIEAIPSNLRASTQKPFDSKNAESVNIKISYSNNSGSDLTGVQVQLLNGDTNEYLTGSTLTARYNKQDTVKNKRATYDAASVLNGQTKTADVLVYPRKAGTFNFRALVTTREGVQTTSLPFLITAR